MLWGFISFLYLPAACQNDSNEQLTEALGNLFCIYAYTVASMYQCFCNAFSQLFLMMFCYIVNSDFLERNPDDASAFTMLGYLNEYLHLKRQATDAYER